MGGCLPQKYGDDVRSLVIRSLLFLRRIFLYHSEKSIKLNIRQPNQKITDMLLIPNAEYRTVIHYDVGVTNELVWFNDGLHMSILERSIHVRCAVHIRYTLGGIS